MDTQSTVKSPYLNNKNEIIEQLKEVIPDYIYQPIITIVNNYDELLVRKIKHEIPSSKITHDISEIENKIEHYYAYLQVLDKKLKDYKEKNKNISNELKELTKLTEIEQDPVYKSLLKITDEK